MSSTFVGSRTSRASWSAEPASWAVLAEAIRRPFAWIERQRRLRRDINLLMSLDDHALADIGLTRGEVFYAARYGRPPKHEERRR